MSGAPWFSLEVRPDQAPWLFRGPEQESSWASTSAELLASLVALQIFIWDFREAGGSHSHILRFGSGTDNRAAEALGKKGLIAKIPLVLVLMEYLGLCEDLGARCHLSWRPRETNVEADDLTNERFSVFDLEKRVNVCWDDIQLPYMKLFSPALLSFSKKRLEKDNSVKTQRSEKFQKTIWG